jgi:hypothetical protein
VNARGIQGSLSGVPRALATVATAVEDAGESWWSSRRACSISSDDADGCAVEAEGTFARTELDDSQLAFVAIW